MFQLYGSNIMKLQKVPEALKAELIYKIIIFIMRKEACTKYTKGSLTRRRVKKEHTFPPLAFALLL